MAASALPIVVTGGSGFLGQNVVRYLVETGHQCVIVDSKTPSVPFVQKAVGEGTIDLVMMDLMDLAAVQAAGNRLPPKFHLVHLAAVIETTTEVSAQTRKTLDFHTGISMNIVDGCAGKIASICYISSWEVYGKPKRLPLDETHELEPFNVYGVGKLMTEGYLRVSCQSLGIPLTILRLSHIYGPGEWHNKALPNFIKNCIAGRPQKLFGGGKDLRQFVHARDVAYAIHLSLGRSNGGIFNIAGRESINVRQLLDLVQNLMGTRLPVEELPADRPPLDLSFDLTHARNGLGYEPQISLEKGVRGEIEWFRSTERKGKAET